jgi:tetratricopeptide (TPR) repeat protein/NAD-dependent SIR2 family protein deacetylase
MASYSKADVSALAGLMNHAKGQKTPFAVLTGAGCSVSAEIPTAQGLLQKINESDLGPTVRRKLQCDDLTAMPYGRVMGHLNAEERKEIIGPCLDNAKVNWGHIALALMMHHGYVGRVLTFNFDSILARACGLIGRYPAIYDFSVVPDSGGRFDYLSQPAIVHLHGQGTSLAMMNSEQETQSHARLLEPLFRDTMERFNLLVIGYSGEADAAFDSLCRAYHNKRRLYWLAYSDSAPSPALQRLTNQPGGFVEHWGGADFDTLMVELAQALGIFPPTLFVDPAQHLLDELAPVIDPSSSIKGAAGLIPDLKQRLKRWKKLRRSVAAQRQAATLREDWQAAIDVGGAEAGNAEDIANLAWAHVMLAEQDVATNRYPQAFANYETALAIKPDFHEALNNWGCDLGVLARQTKDEDLFRQAFDKYAAALAIKPDKHEALYNWGCDLGALARQTKDEDLFRQAFDRYAAALAIKPDYHDALYNWGIALGELARQTKDEDLFRQAFDKYAAALAIKPDDHDALNNWGIALGDLASQTKDEELFQQAFDRYAAALAIKPDKHEALNNWGNALGDLASQTKDEGLFEQAFEKLAAALAIKPDFYEALNNWGNALGDLAIQTEDKELFQQAFDRYAAALAIKPDYQDALHNWRVDLLMLFRQVGRTSSTVAAGEQLLRAQEASGEPSYNLARLLALLGNEAGCRGQLEACKAAGTLPDAAEVKDDPDLAAYRDRDWFKALVGDGA